MPFLLPACCVMLVCVKDFSTKQLNFLSQAALQLLDFTCVALVYVLLAIEQTKENSSG